MVLPAGMRLRPAEIGGLMALGQCMVHVARRPRVGILSSGDEVVSPDSPVQPGQVRDVNSYTLSALVEQAGGSPRALWDYAGSGGCTGDSAAPGPGGMRPGGDHGRLVGQHPRS